MAGEQLQLETVAAPAAGVADFHAQVRGTTRPLLRSRWYSPAHWQFIGFVRDHLSDFVEQGGITSTPMQASLLDELS
jgi:hypothetical protein